jgi:hypothetical protein
MKRRKYKYIILLTHPKRRRTRSTIEDIVIVIQEPIRRTRGSKNSFYTNISSFLGAS